MDLIAVEGFRYEAWRVGAMQIAHDATGVKGGVMTFVLIDITRIEAIHNAGIVARQLTCDAAHVTIGTTNVAVVVASINITVAGIACDAAYVIGTKYFPVVGANIDFAPLYHVISVEPAHDTTSVAAIGSDAAIILNGVGCVTARDLTVVMIHLAHDAASVLVIENVAVVESAVRDGD